MTAITASAVKELREISGVAMMDCKKALVETNGDLEAAQDFLRKKGKATALKNLPVRPLKDPYAFLPVPMKNVPV